MFLFYYGGEFSLCLLFDGNKLVLIKSENVCIVILEGGEGICRILVNGCLFGWVIFVGSVVFFLDGSWVVMVSYEYIDVWDVNEGCFICFFDIDFDYEKLVWFGDNVDMLIIGLCRFGFRKYKIVNVNDYLVFFFEEVLDD